RRNFQFEALSGQRRRFHRRTGCAVAARAAVIRFQSGCLVTRSGERNAQNLREMRQKMRRNLQRSTIVIALLFAVLLQAPPSSACGPFALEAIFSFSKHPEYPLEKFAAGNIGIVPTSYARSYLFVAYRYLNGEGF